MRSFFAEEMEKGSTRARISGPEFTHLKKVLRLSTGDEVTLFNGRGLVMLGVIDEMDKSSAEVRITGPCEETRESPVEITLLQAFVKVDKPEFIIQKATELGAAAISFYSTERSVPLKPNKTREARWRKVAIGAAKQCGRSVLPRISVAGSLADVLSDWEDRPGVKLALWEGASDAGNIKEALRSAPGAQGVVVLVGPEGGFSKEEMDGAARAGFTKVGLGPRILRAETAAVSVLTLVQYELGDLN